VTVIEFVIILFVVAAIVGGAILAVHFGAVSLVAGWLLTWTALRLLLGFLCGVAVLLVALKFSFSDREEVPVPFLESVVLVGIHLLLATPWGWKVVVPIDALVLLMSLRTYWLTRREGRESQRRPV
jgi:hypothetical protein